MTRLLYSSVFLLVICLAMTTAGTAGAASPDAAQAAAEPTAAPVPADHAERMARGLALFKKSVRPILIGRCIRCHGGEDTENAFELTRREDLLRGGADGPVVVPGRAEESRLVKLIRHEAEPHMPEDGAKLSDLAIQHLVDWINLGAPYDQPLLADNEDPLAWTRTELEPSRREFWAFQPLQDTRPPELDQAGWARTDIDRFVLQGLRERGLVPSEPAERRKLARRAAYDLTGLPPDPADVEAFVRDSDPLAYEKLIDKWLDSPHYGERWGRHWLDVARFAESHGFEQDYDRPHAYHYRDFVIQAFNRDLPFDQFVRWQVAGDRLASDDPQAWMATGFLGAGVFPTQLTEKEFEPARYDELDDMIATTGTAFLGLTIGCARCHDHKFDPIPAADYYRLIATFSTAIRGNIDLEFNSAKTQLALAAWQQSHQPLVDALAAYERDTLPGQFERWLKEQAERPQPEPASPWVLLDLVDFQSRGGATFRRLDDGSVLAEGKNPDSDTYTFTAVTELQGIRSIRLEALADPSLVKLGPGRAANGNFGLGSFRVTAAPISGAGQPVELKLVNPRADFQQNSGNLSIAASLDAEPKSGWAVDPKFGENHAAVFETEEPFGFAGGTQLTFTLDFQVNSQHAMGRPRLAISHAACPVPLDGPSQTQAVAELLAAARRGQLPQDAAAREKLIKWYRHLDPGWLALRKQLDENLQKKPQPERTKVMVVSEGIKPIPHHADGRGFPHFYPQTYFLKRGDTQQKQGVATPGFLQVLLRSPPTATATTKTASPGSPSSTPTTSLPAPPPPEKTTPATPAAPGTSSANDPAQHPRVALANWLTDVDQGAGGLLARVIVNRLWQHHFGQGIVATPNDFGFQGSRPTHPELLDWLAIRLIEDGWRLKPMHKRMMTSAVYMQTSQSHPEPMKLDPNNQWLWRYQPRRQEAEVIRDAMLAVSGQLDRTPFGPGSLDESMQRRSIYFMIKRSRLVPMMQIFDSPEPLVGVGQRPSTTIAPQALLFMNGPQVRAASQAFAAQLMPIAEQSLEQAVEQGYAKALSRPPTAAELQQSIQFLQSQQAAYQADGVQPARMNAITDFCQVLFSLNEFVYID